jgi:hypothetical protein
MRDGESLTKDPAAVLRMDPQAAHWALARGPRRGTANPAKVCADVRAAAAAPEESEILGVLPVLEKIRASR